MSRVVALMLTGLLALMCSSTTSSSIGQPVPQPVQKQIEAYAAAWASRNPDAIAALHTQDTLFRLQVQGEADVRGRDAVRQRFADLLRDNPLYSSTAQRVTVGGNGLVVIEYTFVMGPASDFTLGRWIYTPTGRSYAVNAVDVIRFAEDGVAEKVTWLDVDAIRSNSMAAVRLEAQP